MTTPPLPDTLTFEINNRVGILTFNRPDKLNALDDSMWTGLGVVAEFAAGADPDILRVVVFAGAGKAFSVGGDFDEFASFSSDADRRGYIDRVFSIYRAVEEMPVATIAAVDGPALGGGCELTLVCDLVVAGRSAGFGLPETAFGLMPGIGVARGATQLNQHALRYLLLTGETVSGERAVSMGLVSELAPDGEALEAAVGLAERIATRAPLAIREAKRLLNMGNASSYDAPRRSVPLLLGSEDHREGLAAFRERRAPEFDGR